MKKRLMRSLSLINIASLIALLVLPILYFIPTAQAATNLTIAMVRLDRMMAATVTTGTVCARPTTALTEASVIVTFPTGFTVSGTVGDWTVNTTNLSWPGSPTPTAWPGIGTATAADNGTKAVTFPSTDLTVGTTYCFNWTSSAALTTSSAAANQVGSIETQTGAAATIDKSNIAFATITDDTISVTGAVNPTFSFSLPTNTDNFTAALTNGATAETSGSTATITTNARNGWTAWVKSANAGLVSASPGATTIATVGTYPTITTLSAGTTGYLLKVTAAGGSAAPAAGYTTTGANDGGALSTTYKIAASDAAAAASDTVTFTERARVTTTQPPASDYTDTLTVVAAGQF
jgi:hypothetical protein